jgi:hypothetical protein
MGKLTDYYKKKQLMQQLSEELEKLEEDESLKKEMKFEKSVKNLLEAHNKSAKEALDILRAIDPSLIRDSATISTTYTPKRAMKTFTNPHTSEVVNTRGGNHKVLRAWRDQYGAEAVQSWAE